MKQLPINGTDQDWQSKDAYVSHPAYDYYLGLHATGAVEADGIWHNMEAWINIYDSNRKFVCSQSRIFGPIEEVLEDLEKEGWKQVENWDQK